MKDITKDVIAYGMNNDIGCIKSKDSPALAKAAEAVVNSMVRLNIGHDPYWSSTYIRLQRTLKRYKFNCATGSGTDVQEAWNAILNHDYCGDVASVKHQIYGLCAAEYNGRVYISIITGDK